MLIRDEVISDIDQIQRVTRAAFSGQSYSSGTEALIVEALRAHGAMTISLVAQTPDGGIVGHAAASPVTIYANDNPVGKSWFGLGPVSVHPEHQQRGIGKQLVSRILHQLESMSAQGCVVLGDPNYYSRFGFIADSRLRYPGPAAIYFQALHWAGAMPTGVVKFDSAFDS